MSNSIKFPCPLSCSTELRATLLRPPPPLPLVCANRRGTAPRAGIEAHCRRRRFHPNPSPHDESSSSSASPPEAAPLPFPITNCPILSPEFAEIWSKLAEPPPPLFPVSFAAAHHLASLSCPRPHRHVQQAPFGPLVP
jgi:hypothetical protein